MNKPIACHIHDYFEAACVYHYELVIELSGGLIIKGEASNLITRSKIEYLVINNHQTEQNVDLSQIKSVNVITPNAKFNSINI